MCAFATANLIAQVPIIFTATGPPTLTQSDVNTQISGVPYPFSANIYSPITIIDVNAFNGRDNAINENYLYIVNAPDVRIISSYAFYGCTNLKIIDCPLATTISSNAFRECVRLENVNIPLATTISSNAFWLCTGLQNLTLGAVPPNLATGVFTSVPLGSVTLNIPAGSLCAYENHPDWGTAFLDQFDDVVEYPVTNTITNNLTLSVNGNGTAIIGSSGTLTTEDVTCETIRTITATADACYQFDGWTNADNTPLSTNTTETITVVKDSTITANFKLISPAPTYSLSVSSNSTMGTASSSVSSATCGSSVTVTATPNAGYKFVYWQEGSAIVSTADTYIFNITANTSLTAVFDDAKKKTRIKKINVKKGKLIITPQP
ncbi:MAG: leucine-rich repeat protein [Bacteroidetes bacterium]|nr:leucine-rich repeat protein [Bacteroidota bacterium]